MAEPVPMRLVIKSSVTVVGVNAKTEPKTERLSDPGIK